MIQHSLTRRQMLQAGFGFPAAMALGSASAALSPLRFRGVNLAGGEFGSAIPGVMNRDYIYPGNEHIDYFVGKGMNVFRLPFKWERVQPRLYDVLSPPDIAEIDRIIEHARQCGAYVILDPHNYGRRDVDGSSVVIGQNLSVTSSHFADFWARLAIRYRSHTNVIFGLMNEPYDQSFVILVSVLNHAIAKIRRVEAPNLVLVPGNAWTGAHSWVTSGNSVSMLQIQDPVMNSAFEVHQYLDHDSSGTHHDCTFGGGASRLEAFTNWARANKRRGFLGEFAITTSSGCEAELNDLLSYVAANSDVWLGWAYWAGGPWWGEEPFTIAPADIWNPIDRPQMNALRAFL